MAKPTTIFECSECGHETIRWMGKCPECSEWNSFTEKPNIDVKIGRTSSTVEPVGLVRLSSVSDKPKGRMLSGIGEWDRVMGGGLVHGSFVIITGDPGIGKSTLLLQVAGNLSKNNEALYFSSEESLEQVKQRAKRLGRDNDNILFSDQGNIESIIAAAEKHKPSLIVIDSIQNCFVSGSRAIPGTISQLRESAFLLMRLAKENSITVIVTAHVTKEGNIAGPRTLEHIADAVFYLQGEDRWQMRLLRSVKNRFGPINEIGFFELDGTGLHEVSDINKLFISETTSSPGATLISTLEGSRPLILELQALTIPSRYGVPQRVITGVDHKRVVLIAAILEKYLSIKLSEHDIFFKVSGGFKIKESSSDLGIALALLSSYLQKSLPPKTITLGEVALTGRIKPINYAEIHAKEARKFGLETVVVASGQSFTTKFKRVLSMKNVYELLSIFPE